MGLESGTYVSDLVTTNPLGSDNEKQGDDHLRLIKSVLRATFLDTFTAGLYLPKSTSAANALVLATLKNLGFGIGLVNGTLVPSVAASALTVALKTLAGTDPSATDPVYVIFRNVTAATGDYVILTITAATSFVVSSGSTLGTTNSTAFRLWVVGFNDGGTFRLGVVNCLSALSIYPLRDDQIKSSTAEGGAGAADSAQVIYTGTAVASKAMRILGYMEWGSGLGTAGTWSAVPTKTQMFGPGVALPGEVIQTAIQEVNTTATGTTQIPNDNTIPQNTEGDQYFTASITPSSAANLLEIEHMTFWEVSALASFTVALFQDAVANALRAHFLTNSTAGGAIANAFIHRMLSGTTSSTTFKIRAGPPGAVTLRHLNSNTLGNVQIGTLHLREVMA